MTKTRRQSKKQEAAAAAEPATESISASASAPSVSAAQSIAVPDDIDTDFLSSLLPDVSLESPSPDAIVSLYRLVLTQATDYDATRREVEELQAEVERRDVELDQALQDKETATKELESSLETTQNELRQVRQEKDELAVSRGELQAKLASLSTSQSASSTEVETLRHRVEDVEREKRDLMGVVSRLKEDSTQRDEEIHTLRTNLKQARQEYQALESQVRELRSVETSNKFKLESLTQQLQLARDEAGRLSIDLTSKTEEFANYRRQKHAELAQLQASHDSLAQTHAATESTLKALQSSHSSQSHQLAQAQARVQELKGQLAEQEATYSSEAAGLRRLVQMMEEREAQAKSIVENIEKEWAEVGDRAERREIVLREDVETERQRAEAHGPTPTVLFLSSTAIVNVLILFATIWRTYVPEKPYVFSYIGREMPLETPTGPIPNVEMTYQESSRFEIANYSASQPNWDTLIKNQFGIGFHHIGPFHHRFISAAYHSLHCVYTFGRDMEKPNHLNETSHHLVHCMMYLRQLFMCNADSTLEPGDFMAKNFTLDRMGVTRQCRDWRTAAAWIDQNALEWAEYNGVPAEALKQYLE